MAELNSNIDPSTDVGKFRILTGDIEYVDGGFDIWADEEIEVFLEMAVGSVPRAVEYALSSLSAQAAHESKVVKDYDLTVDLSKKATALRMAAERFKDMADRIDADTVGLFTEYPMSPATEYCRPEGWVPVALPTWR